MSLLKLFPDAADNPKVLERLEALSYSFAETPDDLFAKWEAFSLKHYDHIKISDIDTLDEFQTYLEKGARSNQAKKPRTIRKPLLGDSLTTKFKTELKQEPFGESPLQATKIISQLNKHVSEAVGSKVSSPADFMLNSDISQFSRKRPFNAHVRDISTELDNELERTVESVVSHYGISRADIVNPHQISQNTGWAVGRIVREPPQLKTIEEAHEYWQSNEKLDSKSILLECSRRIGGGSRTSLDLSLVQEQITNFFEGQIIVVRGTNPKGDQFVVQEIKELPKLSVARVASTKRSDGPVRIAVAAAPRTAAMLEALTSWVYKSTRQSVSTLVILGPFLSISSMPNSTSLVQEKKRIKDLLQKLSRAVQIPIILIPSPDDAYSVDPLFPQPPFPDSELLVDQPLIRVSNPCSFSIDEVALTVAVNSCINDMRLDNNSEAFKQVLRQRRLYPVYPPPPRVNVDIPSLKHTNVGSVAPNVIVMPSANGNTSCGIVDDVVYIAAGELANGFAVLTVDSGTSLLSSRIGIDVLQFA